MRKLPLTDAAPEVLPPAPTRTRAANVRQMRRGELSRVALLNAASDLMIERATVDVPLSDIADRARLNSALVKYYFGRKQGMMLALLKHVIGQPVIDMRVIMESDLSPAEKLRHHVTGIVNINARYPYITRLIYLLLQDKELRGDLIETITVPVADAHRRILGEGATSGVFKNIKPAIFYFIVFGASEHIFLQTEILRLVYDIDGVSDDLRREYGATLVDVLLTGLARTD